MVYSQRNPKVGIYLQSMLDSCLAATNLEELQILFNEVGVVYPNMLEYFAQMYWGTVSRKGGIQ